MRAPRSATATMLVLAVGGWTAVVGSGTALAETGPTGGKTKARAEGGASTGGAVFQQNLAQSSRQNNNCNNPNAESAPISLTSSRVTGRCVTSDGSLTAFSRINNGPAVAQGGSAAMSLAQQNTAQRGRQNNNCNNPNDAEIPVTGSRVDGHCADQDVSFSKHTLVKGGGARAEGGSSTSGEVFQQNVAQEGRQNNNCNSPNPNPNLLGTEGSRWVGRCKNKDRSFSKRTRIKGGGARAEGGSSSDLDVGQQNVAQEGRQNNNCANGNEEAFDPFEAGRIDAGCGNNDDSVSKHAWDKHRGALAEGGSSTGADVAQQNIAQEGRQNNNCSNSNDTTIRVDASRLEERCQNKDGSLANHTWSKGGGARAEGGSSTGADVEQQNIAQEGRQNNNCHNPTSDSDIEVTGGADRGTCRNHDVSADTHTHYRWGGAEANGGTTSGTVNQQNVAQGGRQNNNCNNPNLVEVTVTEGRVRARCTNKDLSLNRETYVKGGGARAEGGSSTGADVEQQNIAQEGRQNNSCSNPNGGSIDLTGGRQGVSCKTVDGSANLHTATIGGGAKANGGTATGELFQQNIAQEGRQNNTCSNPNNLTPTATGSHTQAKCVAVDHSTNIATINR
ncbi:hypothetical protein [Streptomyces sp. NPDC051776]|uniref:hypothetical protein n=1 Tax=Streptomyces sp. NPDC051776 TaxID=3155414 RepID=UPI00341C8860